MKARLVFIAILAGCSTFCVVFFLLREKLARPLPIIREAAAHAAPTPAPVFRPANVFIESWDDSATSGLPWKVISDMPGARHSTIFATGVLDARSEIRLNRIQVGNRRTYEFNIGNGRFSKILEPNAHGEELITTFVLGISQGDAAADLRATDLRTSGEMNLATSFGKVIVLDFWATWCPACPKRLADLQRLAERIKGNQNVEIITVSVDENPKSAHDQLTKNDWYHPSIRHLWLGPGQYSTFAGPYGIIGLPTVILIDKKARVNSIITNPHVDIEKALEPLLKNERSS